MERSWLSERLPVFESSAINLMPDQNDPKDNHHLPEASTTRFPSMAFQPLFSYDSMTTPWLVQEFDRPVLLVARKMADLLEPKLDAL